MQYIFSRLFLFCFGHAAWHVGSHFPDLMPPALEAWSLNHWKVPIYFLGILPKG